MTTTAPRIHEWTGPTGVHFREVAEPSGVYYREGTPREVVSALEKAIKNRSRIRLFLGDNKTGKGWNEENDVVGLVSNSMGPIKTPILLANERANSGGAILVDCIVCLFVDGREVYRHPNFTMPSIRIAHEGVYPDVPIAAYVDGEKNPSARFASMQKAQRWVDFMTGKRMNH